jgi:hypothetical protein
MQTQHRFVNFEYDDAIHEREEVAILVPQCRFESDLLLSWIRRDLHQDFEECYPPENRHVLLVSKFYRTCELIRYDRDGRFTFRPNTEQAKYGLDDVSLFVHPFQPDGDDDDVVGYEFEIIWQKFGVCYSVQDVGVIDLLMHHVE